MDTTSATLLHSQASSSTAPGVAGEQSPRSPDELVLQVEWASRRYSITFKMLATGVIAGLRFRKQFARKLKLDVRLESCSSGSGQPAHSILPSCNHVISKLEMVSVFSPELVESIKHITRCSHLLQQFGGLEGLAPQLHTDLAKGLPGCAEDLAQRKQAFGENVYPSCRRAARKMTWTALVKEVCSDIKSSIIMVLCAAGLSLGFGIKSNGLKEGWFEGASIIFEVILVVLITAMSNLKQSSHFRSSFQERNTKVVRCGQVVEVPILEVVVGDIVELGIGDSVPADGLLVQSDLSLAIDESDFSRQSCHYLPRKDAFIRSGTKVRDGSGTMLITAVGINTELEGLMALVPDNSAVDESHLQVRLSKAAFLIGKLGLSVVIFILSILFILYFSSHWSIKGVAKFQAGKTTCADIIDDALFPIFSIAVNIVVVALPEGLPDLAITLTLAYSMHKMKATNALVRRLSDCQTMGSATTICSALTWNKMTVVKSWIAGNIRVEEERDAPIIISRLPSQLRKLLLQGIAQGKVSVPDSSNSGQMQDTGVGLDKKKMESKHVEAIGPTAEQALLTWAGKSFQEARAESSKLQLKRFNSAKKPVVDMDVVETSEQTVSRGAAESILSRCHKWVDVKGHAIEITTEKREELETMIADMAACSSNCVAFAYHDMTQECCMQVAGEGAEWQMSEVSNQLTLLAVVGMKYPWKTAVNAMKAAGLTVRMVTGDNLMTANAIAKECGILEKIDEISLEADTLRSWTPNERKAKLPNVVVVAKALPFDKLFLVENLQSAGEVVAFIGNGANDAPALHKANIGLSMEGQGTDQVAKENSDIMILHDDFTALITLVHGGRSLYFNIQKCLQFHLTVNMVAVVVNVVVAVTSAGDVSLTVKHLLWVNFILSIPGAFALATEAALNHELTLQHRPDLPCIINYRMWQNLSFQVIYQVGVLLALQFHGASLLGLSGTPDDDQHLIKRTTIFNTFALCQLFNEVNTRQPYQLNIFRGVPNNSLYICIVASTLVLQIVMVELLERHMHWQQWLVCITLAFLSWPISFLGKVLVSISRRVITYLSLQLDRVGRNMRNINRSMCSSFHTLL